MTVHRLLCPRCQRGQADGWLCSACTGLLEEALVTLAALGPDLEVTVARLDNVARAVEHRPAMPEPLAPAAVSPVPGFALVAHALPVNLAAAELGARVGRRAGAWVARLSPWRLDRRRLHGPACAGCGHTSCGALRGDPIGRPLLWLLTHLDAVRRDPAAARIAADMIGLAARVEDTVDRREPEVYVGPCDRPDVRVTVEAGVVSPTVGICGVDLYARLGDAAVKCRACGAAYKITERREWLLEQVREVWARPGLIAQAFAALDLDLTAARLDTWISRDKKRHESCWPGEPCGHIVPVALDSDVVDEATGRPLGRPMYRVGDVLARVEKLRAARREQEAS